MNTSSLYLGTAATGAVKLELSRANRSAAERTALIKQSPFQMKYSLAVNRESAAEILAARIEKMANAAPQGSTQPAKAEGSLLGGMAKEMLLGNGRRQGLLETAAAQAGRALLRGMLGGYLSGKGQRQPVVGLAFKVDARLVSRDVRKTA
jgi:hypothetical protein